MKLILTSRDEVLIAVRCLRNHARFLLVTTYNDMLKAHAADIEHFNSLNWLARWYNKSEIKALHDHPEPLGNFDQPLDGMIENYVAWARSFERLRWCNTPNTKTLRTSSFTAYDARRVNELANQLNGVTQLYRINVQLDRSETELLNEVLNKCPPNEYIKI